MSQYLEKHGLYPRLLSVEPAQDLYNIIVIPCYNEPSVDVVLHSLLHCDMPKRSIEVIVVVNSSEDEAEAVLSQNLMSIRSIEQVVESSTSNKISIQVIHKKDLPRKHAGVGLARKIGMDEAIYRFQWMEEIMGEEVDGIITCLDADCEVSKNYLEVIESFFLRNTKCPAVSVKYQHPLGASVENRNQIITYELHLRYYNQGLKYAGFPFAYHTVGSAMVVRKDAYQKQGGMNKRKAGEDFYFLHKFIKLDYFEHIPEAIVFPSSRLSDRVPFGTGRAMMVMNDPKGFVTYPFSAFHSLHSLVGNIPSIYRTIDMDQVALHNIDKAMSDYLACHTQYRKYWKGIQRNTASLGSFEKRFFEWMSAFWVMKYLNYYRESIRGGEVVENAKELLSTIGELDNSQEWNSLILLKKYRQLERE